MTDQFDVRRAELLANLGRVRARISDAADLAGRDVREITMIAVTKFFPVADVRLLAELGVSDVGENRHQEAAAKAAECADLDGLLRWHFIGGLQSNKAAAVARYADVVQSVDRAKLLAGLEQGAAERGRDLGVMVQIALDDGPADPGRAGVAPADALELADAVSSTPHVTLLGVMAVAPIASEPARAFEKLAVVAERIRRDHPGAQAISAGMSGDLEEAIRFGATHVRVGSAILGNRRLSK